MTTLLSEYVETLTPRVRGRLRGTALLVIAQEGSVLLTGQGAEISDAQAEADVTLCAADPVFRAILAGSQNPVMAVMTGKLKVIGNQLRALKVSEILVK